MPDTDHAAVVAADAADAFARLGRLTFRWVRACPGQRPPQRASHTRRPRLTIVLAGERRVLAPIDGTITEHRLHSGDVLVVGADGWTVVLPGPPNRILAINSHVGSTHFEAPAGSFDSGGPLNPAATALLTALVRLGTQPGLRPLAPGILHGCVAAALADCRAWARPQPAQQAWARARALAYDRLDASRDALADAAGVHPNHLSRLCRRLEGTSLIAWLTNLRMDRAREMLAAGLPAEAVASACGYADLSHFRRTFRRCHGVPPGAWVESGG